MHAHTHYAVKHYILLTNVRGKQAIARSGTKPVVQREVGGQLRAPHVLGRCTQTITSADTSTTAAAALSITTGPCVRVRTRVCVVLLVMVVTVVVMVTMRY